MRTSLVVSPTRPRHSGSWDGASGSTSRKESAAPSSGHGATRGTSKDPQGTSRNTADEPGTGSRDYATAQHDRDGRAGQGQCGVSGINETCCVATSVRPRPTRSGAATSPKSPPMRASCTWPGCLDLCGRRLLAARCRITRTPSWRTFRGGLAVLCRAIYRWGRGGTSRRPVNRPGKCGGS
jgi:hypothetical protein